MKKSNLECKALRPARETPGFTESGPNEPVSKVESRGSARGDTPNEELGQLPDLVVNSASAFASFCVRNK
jgi:hypothetical protein